MTVGQGSRAEAVVISVSVALSISQQKEVVLCCCCPHSSGVVHRAYCGD